MSLPFFCVVFLLLLCNLSAAQQYQLRLHAVDKNQELLTQQIKTPAELLPASACLDFVQSLVPFLQSKGFLAASVDSIAIDSQQYHVFVYLGQSFRWAKLSFDSISPAVMMQAAINKEQWEGRTMNPRQIARVSEKLLQWAENNGYPFARVWLETVARDSVFFEGKFLLDKGPLMKIDSVVINGDVKVSTVYLMRYLGLKQGELYNEKKLVEISDRLRELPFLQEARPWNMTFSIAKNTLHLSLKEKKANQLNAIVGLLPNSVETGKLLLTVDALFAFQNILGRGEQISLTYQNLQYKSPRLKADVVYPYLFNTPLGIDFHFDLFKKDTAFRRTSLQTGIRYQFASTDYVRFFYQNQSNRLITIDTAFVKQHHQLPENADVAANGAGFEIGLNRTDYRISPRRGWELKLSSSALIRTLRKSDAVTSLVDDLGFDYSSLYDTLISRSNQYRITGDAAVYFPLAKSLVLKMAYQGGWIGGGNLFHNELYQIGGFRLLRGFDEQSIFTSQYHVLSGELRVLLDQNSFFYLFSDNGYITTMRSFLPETGICNGFGVGATLETRSGLFTISYALGRSADVPVQLRQSKVHFGYVAFF